MNLKEELMKALKEAMQNKDVLKKDTITMLRAAILQVEKDTQKELTQTDMDVIVAKEIKKRQESIPDYEKGGRQDLVDKLKREIEILSVYVPKQLTEEEIRALVEVAIKETGAAGPRDMGKVMGALKEKTAGKADGRLVSEIVKEKLNNI
ncbi:MAG: GatB/YqeY domain-containing protein [Clostridia bacterium]|nr:GatB/YqeY domain-containing protein [Clostridia bacterium]